MATKNEQTPYTQDANRNPIPSENGRSSQPMSPTGQGAWAQGSQGYAGLHSHRQEREGQGSYYRAAVSRMSQGGYGPQGGYGYEGRGYEEGRSYGGSGTTGEPYGTQGDSSRRDYSTGYGRDTGYGRGREGWQDRESWQGNRENEESWRGREQRRDWGGMQGREEMGFGVGRGERTQGSATGWEDRSLRERFMNRRWEKEPLTARDVMTRNVRSVQPHTSLRDAAQLMKDENCGIVPVVDESMRLLGVLTDRDMVIRAFREDKVPSQVRVQEVMSDEVEALTEDERLTDVIELMGRKQIRRVPVVDRNDRLLGIISMSDVANRADYDEQLQQALERISSRRSFWSRFFT